MPVEHSVLISVLNVKAVVAAFNQEKALVGAFSVITNLRMELFEALLQTLRHQDRARIEMESGSRRTKARNTEIINFINKGQALGQALGQAIQPATSESDLLRQPRHRRMGDK